MMSPRRPSLTRYRRFPRPSNGYLPTPQPPPGVPSLLFRQSRAFRRSHSQYDQRCDLGRTHRRCRAGDLYHDRGEYRRLDDSHRFNHREAAAPSNLTYPTNPLIATKGVAITTDTPVLGSGTAMSYSISPSLPTGLSLALRRAPSRHAHHLVAAYRLYGDSDDVGRGDHDNNQCSSE